MESGIAFANRIRIVKPIGINNAFVPNIPGLYSSYESTENYWDYGSKNHNKNNHSKSSAGSFDGTINTIKEVYEGERTIFQDFIKPSQNNGPEVSHDCKIKSFDSKSLQIKYSLSDNGSEHPTSTLLKNTVAFQNKKNTEDLHHSFNSVKDKELINEQNTILKSWQSDTISISPEIKGEKLSSNPTNSDKSQNLPSKHVDVSPREQGEFGAGLDPNFLKAYQPSVVEKNIYQFWEENGYFKPKNDKGERFSMVLPPPNVTGTLHLGHAITLAIQDSLARWNRMEGRAVVWIPGLDHAGIATQTVVERWLKQNKRLSRHDIGREKFLEEVMAWKNEKGKVITQQLRKFGASLDWSREIFTMDKRHNEVVVEAIVRLWNAGLIYRKESLINWSCELSSAISDIEVDRLEVSGPTPVNVPGYDKPVVFGELMNIAFKACDSEEEIVVATTRPETMLGDVAIAVHPGDKRYAHLRGRRVWHPLRKTEIPVVTDTAVDMTYGTGAVKITPGHSLTDWDIAQRHNLSLLSVIDNRGYISSDAYNGLFKGMKRFDARDAVRNELTKLGLVRGVQPHTMQIPVCSRSGDVVEYLLKYQWFISCKSMAEKAATAVRAGLLELEPPNHHNTWFSFLDNIRDWCISRQLWWGHRIPMYHATAGHQSVWVAAPSEGEAVARAEALLGRKVETIAQDPDVLDTWFSSALYPLSALGWPNQTGDLERFYPLDLMETGHDILFFWVARMVMLGVQLTGELPFNKVLLHGIVCDAQGRKMSKSLGNVIHPEDVIYGKSLPELNKAVVENHRAGLLSAREKDIATKGQQKLFPKGIPECGTDALRFTLLSHKTKSHLISFDVRECETNHHFMNKIWQASRFSLHWAKTLGVEEIRDPESPSMMDRWILSQLSNTVDTVKAGLKTAEFHLVTAALKDFLYFKFCDYYVEAAKPVLREGSDAEAVAACRTLLRCLDVALRLASPIIPFVTEQLYQYLPGCRDLSCMMADYPSTMEKWKDPELDAKVQLGIDVLSSIRTLKCTNGFYKKHVPVEIETQKKEEVNEVKRFIEVLANCSAHVTERRPRGELRRRTVTDTVADHTLVHISLQDISKEQYEEYFQTLVRKEAKIKKTLEKVLEKTKKPGFKKSGKEAQSIVEDQIRTIEGELKAVQTYIELNKMT